MTTPSPVMRTGTGLARILQPAAPRWSGRNHIPACRLPPLWRDWLFAQGSLTTRLSQLRPGTFHVQVLRQFCGRPTPLERESLRLRNQQSVWVREVILCLADVPLVYARTAVPINSLNGAGRRLLTLGNRSLGSYLFHQPSLRRTPLQVSRCNDNHLGLQWARRSVFTLQGRPLLVSEAFSSRLTEFV